jgi:hypothetical protein
VDSSNSIPSNWQNVAGETPRFQDRILVSRTNDLKTPVAELCSQALRISVTQFRVTRSPSLPRLSNVNRCTTHFLQLNSRLTRLAHSSTGRHHEIIDLPPGFDCLMDDGSCRLCPSCAAVNINMEHIIRCTTRRPDAYSVRNSAN